MALGAFAACVAGSPRSWAASPAGAERTPARAHAVPADATVQRFDIAPGPLAEAVARFASAAGVVLRLPSDASALADLHSPGVSGDFTLEQGLQRLLAHTGLSARLSAPHVVVLEWRAPSEQVLVTARAAQPSSPKYTEPVRNVPQTIAVIPRAVIEAQGATTLRDVLSNVTGLTIQAGEGGAPAGDNLTLRGFSARNDVFVDGVRDLGPQSRDPFNLEQVEVVKGPQSAYTGRGSTGGTINLVSKAPTLAPLRAGTLAAGSAALRRVTADVNQPLGGATALRLNAVVHDSAVPGRTSVESERWGIAPALALGLAGPLRLTVSYFHLQQDNVSDYGIPWVPATHVVLAAYRDRPAPVPRETFYGLRGRDREQLSSDLATVRVERDFGAHARLRSQVRYGRSWRDSLATPPRFASPNTTAINRELRSWQATDVIWDQQTDLTLEREAWGLPHTLVLGVAASHENNRRRTRSAPIQLTTLLDPDPDDVFTGALVEGPYLGDVTGKSVALYAFDTAKLGTRWELSGGLRWDYFDVSGVNTTPAAVARVERLLSGRAGLVFKPNANGSLYVAWGSSLDPSLEGLSYGVANTRIGPERTRSFELGSKWDWAHERAALAVALFRVDKLNARTPGIAPDEPPQVLDGRQRVNGLEVSLAGRPLPPWNVLVAHTWLDSAIVRSNTPAELGRRLVNTPRHALSLWTTVEAGSRLMLGVGLRTSSRRFANTANTRQVPGYWLVDAMASLALGRHLALRLNGNNLADAYYFDRLGGGHVVPGAGRALQLSATVQY
jgi:catecholate siderophore receptor